MPATIVDRRPVVVSDIVDVSGKTPVKLYTAPPNAKLVIRKVYIYNPDTSKHVVTLGELEMPVGGTPAWVKDKIVVRVAADSLVVLGPDDLPADYVATTDPAKPHAWAAKLEASAGTPVKVKIECLLA